MLPIDWRDISDEMTQDRYGRPVIRACMNCHSGEIAWSTGGLVECIDHDERTCCIPIEVVAWLIEPPKVIAVPMVRLFDTRSDAPPPMVFGREGECFPCDNEAHMMELTNALGPVPGVATSPLSEHLDAVESAIVSVIIGEEITRNE